LNILTSKDRPFCAFCNSICGFQWYEKVQIKKKKKKTDQGKEDDGELQESRDQENGGMMSGNDTVMNEDK
jgi:hypothetical protein